MNNRIFIDCEFNGFGGELISMALVSDDGGEFYGVIRHPKYWDKWVYENVYPHLQSQPIGLEKFRSGFIDFLSQYENPIICADWYTDIVHFFSMMAGEDHTQSFAYPCKAELVLIDNYKSEVPHNALSDARAIRDEWMKVPA